MRKEFAKYFVIGISAFVLDIGSLFLLKEKAHLTPVMSVVINQFFLLNFVFFLNKHWSFKAQGLTHKQIMRFLILSGVNYFISIVWIWVASHKIGINYLIARTANIICAVAWNFLLYKFWVYKIHPPVTVDVNKP